MTNSEVTIRVARAADAEAIALIYEPYVRETAITFDYEAPDAGEFASRIERTLEHYPFLVAEHNGRVAGYAYASTFKDRDAYDWACETSVYVDMSERRTGVGKALYQALEAALGLMGVTNLNACIGYPAKPDEHLDLNSVEFHEHLGYAWVGRFHRCGYKFGCWYDMVWMEKEIAPHPDSPAPVRPFSEVRKAFCKKIGRP